MKVTRNNKKRRITKARAQKVKIRKGNRVREIEREFYLLHGVGGEHEGAATLVVVDHLPEVLLRRRIQTYFIKYDNTYNSIKERTKLGKQE